MADRKEWELTDEEFDKVGSEIPTDMPGYFRALDRAIATAAALKALEWAAKQISYVGDRRATEESAMLRKELTDG